MGMSVVISRLKFVGNTVLILFYRKEWKEEVTASSVSMLAMPLVLHVCPVIALYILSISNLIQKSTILRLLG